VSCHSAAAAPHGHGLTYGNLLEGDRRGTVDDLAATAIEADKILVFWFELTEDLLRNGSPIKLGWQTAPVTSRRGGGENFRF
jgi:hypothetical protein